MAIRTIICHQLLFVVLICLIQYPAIAQNEIARERSSLKGIQRIGFTVNLETNSALNKHSQIEVLALTGMGQQTLRKGGISLILDSEIKQSDEIPFLYLHVNTMDAGRGLVPFAITLYFYQPVKLMLNRDLQTSSVTWESGSLGIVSYDRINLINDAARNLLEEFVTDYNRINSTN